MVFHLLPLPYFASAIDQSDSPFLTLYLLPPLVLVRARGAGRDGVTSSAETNSSEGASASVICGASVITGCEGVYCAGGAPDGAGTSIAATFIAGMLDVASVFFRFAQPVAIAH